MARIGFVFAVDQASQEAGGDQSLRNPIPFRFCRIVLSFFIISNSNCSASIFVMQLILERLLDLFFFFSRDSGWQSARGRSKPFFLSCHHLVVSTCHGSFTLVIHHLKYRTPIVRGSTPCSVL